MVAGLFGMATAVAMHAQEDPYEHYVRTSRDFQPVKQDKAFLLHAYPSWTFMPWYYQWTPGHDDEAGCFCRETGINGAFLDRGDTSYLAWIDKFALRFYMDHTAGKGDLHLWDNLNDPGHKAQVHGAGLRPRPLNAALQARLQTLIEHNIAAVRASPHRAAYALDDETSWGHFVHPCMWQATDDPAAFPQWLNEIYGGHAPPHPRWISYEDIRQKLPSWTIAAFDASPLMDQWTFNDSVWNNLIGDLVACANRADPATPCGYVGAQQPSPFGGYDYAKLMRKVQFIEAYNIGCSQAIIRSFNPRNAMPAVTTYFYADRQGAADDAAWQAWYYLAQGNRGHIAWVENWFDGRTPRPWLKAIAPTYLECGQKIGPLMSGAEWQHDGIAVYYSHASLQLGWILDAQAHGKTWVNRNDDARLGSAPQCRKAWLDMLRDEGLQFSFISYAEVVQSGVPAACRVLILPAVLCLSDAEARQIRAFCEGGGTVIADYMPGLWDEHGKGRPTGGVLDSLFGVRHPAELTCKDDYNGNTRLRCETDQDANYGCKSPRELLSRANTCLRDPSGFNKAVRSLATSTTRQAGRGTAVLMNLSPQWYNAYRLEGAAAAERRAAFMAPIHNAGVRRWVSLKAPGESAFGAEITYWTRNGRTLLFLVANKDVAATDTGGGAAVGLQTNTVPVTLVFDSAIRNVRDERATASLGNGREFRLMWKRNEACVLSFDGGARAP